VEIPILPLPSSAISINLIVTRLRAGRPRFDCRHRIQISSGAHPASSPVGTGDSYNRGEADHSPPSSAKVWKFGILSQHYTASQLSRPGLETSPPWKSQSPHLSIFFSSYHDHHHEHCRVRSWMSVLWI